MTDSLIDWLIDWLIDYHVWDKTRAYLHWSCIGTRLGGSRNVSADRQLLARIAVSCVHHSPVLRRPRPHRRSYPQPLAGQPRSATRGGGVVSAGRRSAVRCWWTEDGKRRWTIEECWWWRPCEIQTQRTLHVTTIDTLITNEQCIKKVKADIALPGNPVSELRDVTCHMRSHKLLPATRHKWTRPA